MTMQEASRYSMDKLTAIYEPTEAAAISDWLMEHLSGAHKTDRIAGNKKQLPANQVDQLEGYLKRLLTHEPVQYVLNEAWFCGLRFYVDNQVLIPRPETEELVEWIITHCKFPVNELSILDIGTGSGCISIALKRRLGKAEVWSCDVSNGALAVASRNADDLGVSVRFLNLNFLSETEREQLPRFDIIVSNPPYIPDKDKAEMHTNVLGFEPATALFVPDNDPLLFYKAIADFGKSHLLPNGIIYTELHKDIASIAREMFESRGYVVEIKKDMQGVERMLRAMRV
jgi:release factor glutamine methyltransferase